MSSSSGPHPGNSASLAGGEKATAIFAASGGAASSALGSTGAQGMGVSGPCPLLCGGSSVSQPPSRISCAEEGLNPKVTNLIPGYESSVMDLILISDSNIRVDKHYLTDLVATMPKGCSLVSSLVAGRCSRQGQEALFPSLGGALESLTLNAFVTRWISLSSAVGLVPVVGKSILIDRRSLNELGGLRYLLIPNLKYKKI